MAFTCPKCQRVSHNLHDEDERYCGACHQFFSPAGAPMLELAEAFDRTSRREALMRQVQPCPVCKSRQVQLVAFTDDEGQPGRVEWKCRECKHPWSWHI